MDDIYKGLNIKSEYNTSVTTEESFFSATGRINRKPFFFRMFILAVISVFISSLPFDDQPALFGFIIISFVILTFFQILQMIKRCQDLSLSGWYTLLSLIPLLNVIFMLYLFFKKGVIGANEYGSDPLKYHNNKKRKSSNIKSDIFDYVEKKTSSNQRAKSNKFDLNDLEKLSDLRNKGVITEEEFRIKKREILEI